MEITEVKVFPIREDKLKAFVSVVFDGCFMINDIKIIQGRDGLFISMPSRKKKNGEFKDVAHPLNNQTRGMMEDCILGEYERVLAEREAQQAGGGSSAERPARPPRGPRDDRQPPVAAGAARPSGPSSAPAAPAFDRAPREAAVAGSTGEKIVPAPSVAARVDDARAATGGAAEVGDAAVADRSPRPGGDGSSAPSPDGVAETERAAAREDDGKRKDGEEKTLEEVEELHLRDSFWTVS